MLNGGISHARMMRESEDCIEAAARHGGSSESRVANRLLGDVRTWQQWESEHSRLLRSVADLGKPGDQDRVLRIGTFSLIHRRAPFEYLRDHQLRGAARERLVAQFHGLCPYDRAMVTEHGQYLRSAGSFICAQHVGSNVFHNHVFQGPMQRYEELFREYFATFCAAALARQGGASPDIIAAQECLLPLLKYDLARLRQSILAMPRMSPEHAEDVRLRTPNGDTVRLKRPFQAKRP